MAGILLGYNGSNLLEKPPTLMEISISLGRLCRYNGHCHTFWSVLAHSMCVADILPDDLKLYGLLHDAGESIIGDIPTPVKLDSYVKFEMEQLQKIFKSLSITFPTDEQWKKVMEADYEIFCAEAYTICSNGMIQYADIPDQKSTKRVSYYVDNYSITDNVTFNGRLVDQFYNRAVLLIKDHQLGINRPTVKNANSGRGIGGCLIL